MRLASALVVTRRVLRQIVRDRRTLGVIIMQPLVIMAIFGYAFGGEIADAQVAVANLDRGTFAAEVLEHVDPVKVRIIELSGSAAVEAAVLSGDARFGVVFPHNFTANTESAMTGRGLETTYLVYYKDNTDPQLTGAIIEAFGDALTDAIDARYDRDAGFVFEEVIVFGGEDASTLEFLVPGVAAFSIFMLGSKLTAVSIVKERSQGTLSRILVSPITRAEVVTGYVASYGLFSALQALSVLTVATLVFRVPIHGNVILALVAATLVGIVALGFGILISGLATNEFQATQSVFFVAFPNLFLAGVFAPIEAMPKLVQPLSRLVPLTYAVDAMRAILNRGATLTDVAGDLFVLSSFALAFLGGAAVSFGRRE